MQASQPVSLTVAKVLVTLRQTIRTTPQRTGKANMKTRFVIAIAVVLLVGLTEGASREQRACFRADVPFEFVIGRYTLPPGQYIFERLLGKAKAQDSIGILVVRSADSHIYRAIVTAMGSQRMDAGSSDSKLMFTRHESRHYLDRVWLAGDEVAHVLPNVPREAMVAKEANAGDVISLAQLR